MLVTAANGGKTRGDHDDRGALLNQKGGIGKTMLSLHLAGEWAREGKRVLLIDADPQGSALDRAEQRARPCVLQAIDAVEQLGVDPADACPDHWRQLHNRLASGEPPRAYTADRHRAWLLRRRIET